MQTVISKNEQHPHFYPIHRHILTLSHDACCQSCKGVMTLTSLPPSCSATRSLAIPLWGCRERLCLTALREIVHICVSAAVTSWVDFPPARAVPEDLPLLGTKASGRMSCFCKPAARTCAVAL